MRYLHNKCEIKVISKFQNKAAVYNTCSIFLTNFIFDFTFCDCTAFFFRNVFYENSKPLCKHVLLLISVKTEFL